MPNDAAPAARRTLSLGTPSAPRPATEAPKTQRPATSSLPTSLSRPQRLGASEADGLPTQLVGQPAAAAKLAPVRPAEQAAPRLQSGGAEPDLPSLTPRVTDTATAPVVAPPLSLAPAPEPPPAPEPKQSEVVIPVAAMYEEVTQPLSELIEKRTAADFKHVFEDMVKYGVSDVHITRSGLEQKLTVEARLDGDMQLVHVYEGIQAMAIVNRLKTDSSMTTGKTLIPEDGKYELPINGYPYRARAAALPLFDTGEKLVFRMPQIGAIRKLAELGFTEQNTAALLELLAIPGGMLLFAGPTGEGKSTTALSSIDHLRALDVGVVMTLEDPVERVLPGVAQIEVREEVDGAGFGDMAKYLNRSDANVLFLGEIRDRATANAAIELAKSGRRVIATFHASDNISALLRLIKMSDSDPLSVLDAVNGVVSQRLVPRLVPGTDRFSGRYPIHEVTRNSDDLTDALVEKSSRKTIRAAAAPTSTTFKDNVDALVNSGITTLEAARKVVRNV